MNPKIVITIKDLDINEFSTKLERYLNERFNELLLIRGNDSGLIIEYKKNEYHLELPIFFGTNEISFYSHFWKIDAGTICGFGSFLQHLIKAWVYSEFNLEKPVKPDLNLSHRKFKNYKNWEKYILKNRGLLFKMSAKINNPAPKELINL